MNREKYSILPVGTSGPFGPYNIGSSLLKNATQERDLGVIISPDHKSNQDTKKKVVAAYRMFHSIRSASRLTQGLFRLLFTSHVRPLLRRGLPATYPLTNFECDMIGKVQRRGSRSVSELRDLSYSLRLKQLNLFSLDYRRHGGDLSFTRRILRGELERELKEFFHLNTESSTKDHGIIECDPVWLYPLAL
ncbi:unnamed protein product [Dicrocoelium dendriticum]|nr:unnamed protein product [Dicrocoelium dendriticum]